MSRDPSEFGGESVEGAMDPGAQHKGHSVPDVNDPSKFGGESVEGAMDPGPQPAPESDQTPSADDPSKWESGGGG